MALMLKNKLKESTAYTLLLNDLRQAKSELDIAYSNFENVVDPDLIDSCIFHLNAVQMRYKFLLNRVKQLDNSYVRNQEDIIMQSTREFLC